MYIPPGVSGGGSAGDKGGGEASGDGRCGLVKACGTKASASAVSAPTSAV